MFVYGPVPSRKLGSSLGVSPIPPKSCSYSCVYCQLGRTNHFQINRESFFDKNRIFEEIARKCGSQMPDYVTFAGDGEPTLCRDLGWLIRQVKQRLGVRTAVITNGSLLFRKDVRQDLEIADIVIPSLDAGDERLYNIINRPHCGIDFSTTISGLIEFRNAYSGQLWLETMLIKGLNDNEKELLHIRQIAARIRPDRLYIHTPIRPPAEKWVVPPPPDKILLAQEILGEVIPLAQYEIGDFGLQAFENARETIIAIGSRHPLRRDQALRIEEYFNESGLVARMVSEAVLIETVQEGIEFLIVARQPSPKSDRRVDGPNTNREDETGDKDDQRKKSAR